MPYIVTTHKPDHATWSCNDTRRAVATIQEAREAVPIRWNVPEGRRVNHSR